MLRDPDLAKRQFDSTTIKAHPIASTSGSVHGEKASGAWRCLGRSRGGLTTRLHASVDVQGTHVAAR